MLFHFLFLHHILYPGNINIDLLILYYCITIVSQMLFFVCLQYHYNFCKQQILIWAADLGFVFIAFSNGFNSFLRRDSISITDLPHRYPNSHSSFIIGPVTPAAWGPHRAAFRACLYAFIDARNSYHSTRSSFFAFLSCIISEFILYSLLQHM